MISLVKGEVPDLGANEVPRDRRHELEEPTVRDSRDAPYLVVVVLDKTDVADQRGEVGPTWEALREDHETAQAAVSSDPGIHVRRQVGEVRRLQLAMRGQGGDTIAWIEFNIEHCAKRRVPSPSEVRACT